MSERSEFKTRKQVEVWKDDFEWFKRTHGQEASFSWLTSILLHAYREVCENPDKYGLTSVTPDKLTTAASLTIKEELDEGLHRE